MLSNLSFYFPKNTYEWVMFAIIIVLLLSLLLWNKALLKSKLLIEGYVNDIRSYDKYISINKLTEDYAAYKDNPAWYSTIGDMDV